LIETLTLVSPAARRSSAGVKARRPPARLQSPRGEALHLEVEALALAGGLADQVGGRHEVALEAEREGVHAPVSGRRIRLAMENAATRLAHLELVTRERILRHDEERESARPRFGVGVRAREQRQHVGPTRERAPGLGAVDGP
jgi:hypothetical protein